MARIWHSYGVDQQLQLQFSPTQEIPYAAGVARKSKKKKEEKRRRKKEKENLEIIESSVKLEHILTLYTKINSK